VVYEEEGKLFYAVKWDPDLLFGRTFLCVNFMGFLSKCSR
jgi:hypothetical protein